MKKSYERSDNTKKNVKKSIAQKVTSRVSWILLTVFAVLLVLAFIISRRFVISKTKSYSRAVLTVYSDIVSDTLSSKNVPLDADHADTVVYYGNYLCFWYDIDYAYMYVPDTEKGTIRYIAASEKVRSGTGILDNNLIGYEKEHVLSSEERDIWEEKKIFTYEYTDNEYGHVFTTMLLSYDSFGNKAITCVDVNYSSIMLQVLMIFALIALIDLISIVVVYFAVNKVIKKQVSEPAEMLCSGMTEFLSGGQNKITLLSDNDTYEYSQIASAFNTMTQNIQTYLSNIEQLTKQESNRNAELGIASKIQLGFLPNGHIKTEEYDIDAVMIPAKDIGGDLYDYLSLDDTHTLLVIADVSGKGVSAAIFMAVTLVLIHQYAKMGLSPSEILERTNDSLASNNPELLFATAFVAIYNSADKSLSYSNAGHNPPYIIGKTLKNPPIESCTMLGLFENEKYTQETAFLETGDMLFMYTDGVSEAVNEKDEFFGTERIELELEKFRRSHRQDVVSHMRQAISDHAGTAEQHDDITMLAITVKETTTLYLDYDIREFTKIKDLLIGLELPRNTKLTMCLAAEECFVNICSYAFEGKPAPDGEKIKFVLTYSDRIEMFFEDSGIKFNPLEHIIDIDQYDMEKQVGGLGDFIAFESVDDKKYEYKDGKNRLTLIKYIEEEKQ